MNLSSAADITQLPCLLTWLMLVCAPVEHVSPPKGQSCLTADSKVLSYQRKHYGSHQVNSVIMDGCTDADEVGGFSVAQWVENFTWHDNVVWRYKWSCAEYCLLAWLHIHLEQKTLKCVSTADWPLGFCCVITERDKYGCRHWRTNKLWPRLCLCDLLCIIWGACV